MQLNQSNISIVLENKGYTKYHETKKAQTFFNHKNYIYLLPNNEITIVVSPEIINEFPYLKQNNDGKYHSTALSKYPKRIHTGKTPINYGYKFIIREEKFLDKILIFLR